MCFKYSDGDTRSKLIKIENGGDARTEEGLVKCIGYIRSYQSDRDVKPDFEKIMRALNMCAWSWPFSRQEEMAVWVVSKCSSDFGITMPYPGIPVDEQPNLFFEFLSIYNTAKSDYMSRVKDGNV